MFKFTVYSDIHIGSIGTPSEFIFNNIKMHLQKYKTYIKKSDAIVLSGDMSHKLLSLGGRDSYYYIQMLLLFADICIKENKKLIILEGTASHDMGQFRQIEELLKDKGCDYLYVDKISIAKVNGLNILFIPDNHSLSGNKILEIIDNMLYDMKLPHADMAITHNSYTYQLPVKLKSSIDETRLLQMVKGYIVSGHIHKPSTYDRILVPGSFDRLAHGEEEEKGALYCEVDNDINHLYYERLPNEKAMIYKTLDVIDTDNLEKVVNKYPKGSHIRIIGDNINEEVIQRLSEHYTIDVERIKKEKVTYDLNTAIEILSIHPDNIMTLLEEEIGIMSNSEYDIFKNEMKAVI